MFNRSERYRPPFLQLIPMIDVILTLLLPTLIFLVARYRPKLLR